MTSQTIPLRVAGTIFGIMCIAQLLRLIAGVEILVAGHRLPLWVSAIAVVVAGGLSFWMWRGSGTKTTTLGPGASNKAVTH